MAHQSKHTHTTEHYTVTLALTFSIITTFLLGMFLTETLWNGSLRYFSDMSQRGQMQRAYSQYVSLLSTQKAEAQVLMPIDEPDDGTGWLECINSCVAKCDANQLGSVCRNSCVMQCNTRYPK